MNETTKAIKLGELLDFLNTLEKSDRARAREFNGGCDELYRHYDSRAAAYRAVARWANESALPLKETTTREKRFAELLGENTELRQEVQQLEAIIERLKAERNNARLVATSNKEAADNWKRRYELLKRNLSQVSEQLHEASGRVEYWRGRALGAEMALFKLEMKAEPWE